MYAPDHVIEMITANLKIAQSNSVMIFEKDNVEKSLIKVKDDSKSTFLVDKFIAETSVDSKNLNINVTRKDQ